MSQEENKNLEMTEAELIYPDGSGEYEKVPVELLDYIEEAKASLKAKKHQEELYKEYKSRIKAELEDRGLKKIQSNKGNATLVDGGGTKIKKDELDEFLRENTDKTLDDFKTEYSYKYIKLSG